MTRAKMALAAALVVACSAAPAGPAVVFDGAKGATRVRVEIADTDALRDKGLMGRRSLDDDAGMLFAWSEDTTTSFWMKDTLIPLSIAFISADGRVLAVLDMEPCRADPCPMYDPHVAYRSALEANQGALARWGVHVGDRARLVR